jgi:hypothetical protein
MRVHAASRRLLSASAYQSSRSIDRRTGVPLKFFMHNFKRAIAPGNYERTIFKEIREARAGDRTAESR